MLARAPKAPRTAKEKFKVICITSQGKISREAIHFAFLSALAGWSGNRLFYRPRLQRWLKLNSSRWVSTSKLYRIKRILSIYLCLQAGIFIFYPFPRRIPARGAFLFFGGIFGVDILRCRVTMQSHKNCFVYHRFRRLLVNHIFQHQK